MSEIDFTGPDREMREPRADTRAEKGRKERVPLGAPTSKLKANVPDGMVGRWVNDTVGRIQQALEGGYEFISDKATTGERESGRTMIVGTNVDGSPMVGYLMAIPQTWYDEDQKKKGQPLDEFDKAINRGIPQGAEGKAEQGSFYDGGSSLKHNK